MPDLILLETGGQFEPTAALIDQAEESQIWWELRDQLVARHGEPQSPVPRRTRRRQDDRNL